MSGKPTEFDSGLKVDGDVTIAGNTTVTGNLTVTGSVLSSGVATSDFVPSANIAYSLGNSTATWLNMHISNFVSNTTAIQFRNLRVTTPVVTTSYASLSVPPGTTGVVPATPANGDIWTQTVNSTLQVVQVQLNSATKNLVFSDGLINVASRLETARTISFSGDATGSNTFNGTGNIDIPLTLSASYYTQAQADARFANLSAPVIVTSINPTANDVPAGNNTKRWAIWVSTANVSGLASFAANTTFAANVAITGNLTVGGSPIDVTAGHISTTANGITFTGGGTTNSQIIITRGAEANAVIRWNEAANVWMTSNGDGTYLNNVVEQNTVAYAISISGIAANATHATTAANAVAFNGQAASYYTDIAARLGYTAANKAGDAITGIYTFAANITPTTNAISLGGAAARWVMFANTIDIQGTSQHTGVATFSANIVASQQLAVTNAATFANTLGVTGAVTLANTLAVTGIITGTLTGTANNANYLNNQAASYYTSATNMSTGTLPEARLTQANATTNGIMRVLDSVVNTSITIAAAANSVKLAFDTATLAYAAANAAGSSGNASSITTGTLSTARLSVATTNDFRANVVSKVLTTDSVWAEANIVALTPAANIATNLNTGFNFSVSLSANANFDNPTNMKPGQSGIIMVTHSADFNSLTWGSYWKFPSGVDGYASYATGSVDVISYYCANSTFILTNMSRAYA